MNQDKKKPYRRPTITQYGSVRELTAGGSGGGNEYYEFTIFGIPVMGCQPDDMISDPDNRC